MVVGRDILTSAIILLAAVQIVYGIVCTPDICNGVKCTETNCTEDQVVRKGFCGCCDVCHTILSEGQACFSIFLHIHGGSPPTVSCDEGLICKDGKCQKIT